MYNLAGGLLALLGSKHSKVIHGKVIHGKVIHGKVIHGKVIRGKVMRGKVIHTRVLCLSKQHRLCLFEQHRTISVYSNRAAYIRLCLCLSSTARGSVCL